MGLCKKAGKKRGLRSTIMRSPAQKFMCKDHGRNGQARAVMLKVTYTTASNRVGSRSGGFSNENIRCLRRTGSQRIDGESG
ncbi:hypothetical protein BVJ53_10640 [Lacticaseibacillus chiayiensis]|uniref:Uncharacterized protein n=1 Tax=Lacticaseibacillus chiayiensis TaxID=2100821 RepID=A0A4Q1TRC4_9LACO|nr:hypothetical protein BVJ53_10640 [Lacticaseibacillus chiayiensis]RXT58299.1 hypothetical protein CHT97_06995 [Lacticaseibacillus chiayiensis]